MDKQNLTKPQAIIILRQRLKFYGYKVRVVSIRSWPKICPKDKDKQIKDALLHLLPDKEFSVIICRFCMNVVFGNKEHYSKDQLEIEVSRAVQWLKFNKVELNYDPNGRLLKGTTND